MQEKEYEIAERLYVVGNLPQDEMSMYFSANAFDRGLQGLSAMCICTSTCLHTHNVYISMCALL